MAEITPEVTRLLSKVETYLSKLERKERGLVARSDLLAGRLSMGGTTSSTTSSRGDVIDARRKSTFGATTGQAGMEERMRVLRGRKERLGYAIERLNLKAGQRERQLRQSMAHQ